MLNIYFEACANNQQRFDRLVRTLKRLGIRYELMDNCIVFNEEVSEEDANVLQTLVADELDKYEYARLYVNDELVYEHLSERELIRQNIEELRDLIEEIRHNIRAPRSLGLERRY
jgi:hypothetical protein